MPETLPLEELLTAADAARVLRFTPVHVRRLAARGELASLRLNGRRRFKPSDLAAYIDRHRRNGGTLDQAA